MKKITSIFIFGVFITITAWLIIEGSKPEILPVGSKLPELTIKTIDSKVKVQSDNMPVVILYFSTECPHCRYELNLINDEVEKINNVNFYMLTSEKDFFIKKLHLSWEKLVNSKNFEFGIVNKDEFVSSFGGKVTPALFFFNVERKLTNKIFGEVKLEKILYEVLRTCTKSFC